MCDHNIVIKYIHSSCVYVVSSYLTSKGRKRERLYGSIMCNRNMCMLFSLIVSTDRYHNTSPRKRDKVVFGAGKTDDLHICCMDAVKNIPMVVFFILFKHVFYMKRENDGNTKRKLQEKRKQMIDDI